MVSSSQVAPAAIKLRFSLRRLVWLLAVVTYLLMGGTIVVLWLQARIAGPLAGGESSPLFSALWLLANVAVPPVGAAIAVRQPRNAYGWLWLAVGLVVAVQQFSQAYAVYGLVSAPGSLPLAAWVLLLASACWLVWIGIIPFLLLLFPTGQLLSRRWRPVAWAVIAAVACGLGVGWATPGQSGLAPVENPFGMPGALGTIGFLTAIAATGVITGAVLLAAASLVIRYRRASGIERQQLKWLAFGALPLGLYTAASFWLPGIWNAIAGVLAISAMPVAVGIAILRYRLYDIDVIIRRTLVYALLTPIVAGLIAVSMKVSESLFLGLAGRDSPLAVLFTTLVVTSAFTPIKDGTKALVKRWLKEVPDPDHKLKAFHKEIRERVFPIKTEDMACRLLEEAVEAFDTRCGAVYLTNREARTAGPIHATCDWKGKDLATALLASAPGAAPLGKISLGRRCSGREYSRRDREMLERAAQAAALAIEQDRDML